MRKCVSNIGLRESECTVDLGGSWCSDFDNVKHKTVMQNGSHVSLAAFPLCEVELLGFAGASQHLPESHIAGS